MTLNPDAPNGDQITLGRAEGEETYRVVPQGVGRMERKLRAITAVFGGGSAEQAATSVDPGVLHEALQVFIPDLMPEWKMRGYRDADALDRAKRGEATAEDLAYEENSSPTLPQIIEAIETIYRVNGADRLVKFLGKFVNLDLLQGWINTQLADWATRAPALDSPASPSSPQANGASGQPSSSTPAPTASSGEPVPSP